MTRNRKRGRKKRKANRGSFQKGFDPRRHVFTAQDCRIGYWVAAIKHPELREWLRMKIRIYYHERSKHAPQENGGRNGCDRAGADCVTEPEPSPKLKV